MSQLGIVEYVALDRNDFESGSNKQDEGRTSVN